MASVGEPRAIDIGDVPPPDRPLILQRIGFYEQVK